MAENESTGPAGVLATLSATLMLASVAAAETPCLEATARARGPRHQLVLAVTEGKPDQLESE